MEAKDTIAEISFKAGFKYALEGAVAEGAYESIKKVGIREVVDLLMTTVDYECEDENGSPTITFWFSPEEWQTKLKEWGIKT